MCIKTKVRTGQFQVYIAPLWIRTSPNQVECRLKKERENRKHSHHYPTEGAPSQQTSPNTYKLPQTTQDFGEIKLPLPQNMKCIL